MECNSSVKDPLVITLQTFYTPEAKLVIEVDSGQHYNEDTMGYDHKRDAFLRSHGLKFIRFSNSDVYKNIDGIIEKIVEAVE